ncbi:MAG TPA: HNH endonuclease [Patescibacteria group bacterium]|nr:HNH endonuclease [Patescibacteria group bacterium]
MKKEDKLCIDCGKKGVHERKRCLEHSRTYNTERARIRYQKVGRHYFGISKCSICKKDMKIWRIGQVSHAKCRPSKIHKNDPIRQHGRYEARKIIDQLGITTPKGFVTHHLDYNPTNNEPNNLSLMDRRSHGALHRHIEHHWSLWLKNHSSNSENCWNILRDHLTTAWFEKTSAKVIKISDIGQSAAEPLSNEEGSETTPGKPNSKDTAKI